MDFNTPTLFIGILLVAGIAALYLFAPDFSPTALVTTAIPPTNPFLGKVTRNIEQLFRDNPQAVIEQDGRTGLLLPGGNSVQFANDESTTDKDVVFILNAAHQSIAQFHTYPEFVSNEFTYISPEQLAGENPYVRAQYPNGLYLMPVDLEG
jgi:hypothetical protein